MIYYRADARLTSSLHIFSSAVLKWRKVLTIRIIFYVTGQKRLAEKLNRFEKLEEEIKIKPFFFQKMIQKTFFEQSQSAV